MTADENSRFMSTHPENDVVLIGATSSITFHAGDGTDTDTDRYLNIPGGNTYGYEVLCYSKAVSISKINGRSLKGAISVGTTYGYRSRDQKVQSITITTGDTDTLVEVFMKGG